MEKINVGFITQPYGSYNNGENKICGVGIKGKLISEIIKNSTKYNFITGFISNENDLYKFFEKNKPLIVIYNFHETPTRWVGNPEIQENYPNIIHVMIHYDIIQKEIDAYELHGKFKWFKHIITDNPTFIIPKHLDNVFFKTARSIPFVNEIREEERIDSIPIIGFQGVPEHTKGIHKIAHYIQQEFDEAIFRLHIPDGCYGDPEGNKRKMRIQEIYQIIKKPGIKVEVTSNFLTDEEVVKWLNKNTINCYFYDQVFADSGIASSPDYALAAKRPLAVTSNCNMFLHLQGLNPTIEIEKSSLKEIIKNGIEPLRKIYEKNSQKNVVKDYEDICDKLLSLYKK